MDCCIVNSQCAIRTMSNEQGEPLFCAKDVSVALGYDNSREALRKHVDRDDVTKRDTIDSLGREQLTSFINESGLYALILGSTHKAVRRHVENEDGMKRPTPTASNDCKSI